MTNFKKDFELYAKSMGINPTTIYDYTTKGFKNPQNIINYINPTIIEERPMNVAPMDVFSRLMMERIIWLGSEVNAEVANIINAQMMYLSSIGEDDIKFYINSPGGDVTAGLSMYDTMNLVTPDVATTCAGLAASMGSVLLSSGAKGKRSSLPHGSILVHQPMGGTHPYTQESDFRIAYEEIKKCKDELYRILSENTGKTIEEITADADRDKWFTSAEALDYGLIDKIISTKN